MELILFFITAPLSVALLIYVFVRRDDTNRLEGKCEALFAKNEELRELLRDGAKKDREALSAIRECYDNEIERQKKEIEEFHADRIAALKKLLAMYEESNESGTILMRGPDEPPLDKL